MPKMSTDLTRHALNGPTMGTRWSALFYTAPGFDVAPLRAALQAAVDEVDAQMSTWRPASDLMLLNAAPPGVWIALPDRLLSVLAAALQIGRATQGAFDIGLGDAVTAWGFSGGTADPDRIRAARTKARRPVWDCLELDPATKCARKTAPITLDLSGIAKGYGVDRLAEVLQGFGQTAGLVAIDGEVRALGTQPDGTGWPVAVEAPDTETRAVHSLLALENAAVATSGDYRHWVRLGPHHLSHTIDPRTGAPLLQSPASVTVVAETCMQADALATALMVMGADQGRSFAEANRIDALFLLRKGEVIEPLGVGQLFAG